MDQRQQLIDRIRQAQNILVTVSANPSVDQLSAAIGLTLVLNKLGKHGTAVFSGEVPSTIEFLKPEKTLEKNTDSLRDFIIALDKSKADKLRYKVEDQVVRIFITPYKTSISERDLDFSQGDFNVDVVVGLGVIDQKDLDSAITAHGRILHDATVASLSTGGSGNLGSINWVDEHASGLSEMAASLSSGLDKKAFDGQIATAFLTGVVASTERFRNDHTTPDTMSLSAELMAAGANPQLIATELETPPPPPPEPEPAPEPEPEPEKEAEPQKPEEPQENGIDPLAPGSEVPPENPPVKPPVEPGTLQIDHGETPPEPEPEEAEPEKPKEPDQPQIDVTDEGRLINLDENKSDAAPGNTLPDVPTGAPGTPPGIPTPPTEPPKSEVSHQMVTEPPKMDQGELTANTSPDDYSEESDELTLPPVSTPLLSHNATVLSSPSTLPVGPTPAAGPVSTPPVSGESTASLDQARNAVEAALSTPGVPAGPLKPIEALNALPLGSELHAAQSFEQPPATLAPPVSNPGFSEPTPGNSPADQTLDMPLPSSNFGASPPPASSQPGTTGGVPPVPPPFVPPQS